MKILVVDDNPNITKSLERYLKIVGYDAKICNDGFDGLDYIQNEKWDAILLDLSMPDCSGFDIIETLEKNKTLKDQKIFLFTAAEIPEHAWKKLLNKEGVKGCLKKPISLVSIVDAIAS